jgi:Co/Zn/Cd efflux system component
MAACLDSTVLTRVTSAVLWTVIGINKTMFLTEMIAGQLAGSQALKADALDFLTDTVTYGLSLAVIGTTLHTRAMAALFKGLSLSLMALRIFGSTIYHTFVLGLPSAELMGGIAVLALAANVTSVQLLLCYKDGDANVRSVWLRSRNDAIGNVIVLLAAAGVWGTGTPPLLNRYHFLFGFEPECVAQGTRTAAPMKRPARRSAKA